MTQKDVGVGQNAGHGIADLMTYLGQRLVFAAVVFSEGFFNPLLLRYIDATSHVAGEITGGSKQGNRLV